MASSFMIAFNAVAPLMVYLLVGQIVHRMGWMSQTGFRDLNRLSFKLLLPINLMMNIYNTDITETFRGDVLLYSVLALIGICILFGIIIYKVEPDPSKRGVMLQGSFRSNFVLFGLPIAASLLDGRDIGMTTVLIAVNAPLFNVLSVIALSIFQQGQDLDFKELLLTILKNPMLIGTMVGIVIRLLGIRFPEFLETSLNGITASITPLALMAMGGTFNFEALGTSRKQLNLTLFLKLIASPAIVLAGGILLGYRDENLIPLIVLFAGPTAVSSYTMATEMDGDEDLASQIVIFSTGGSMITMMIFIALLNYWGLI